MHELSKLLKKENRCITKIPRNYLGDEFKTIYNSIDPNDITFANLHLRIIEIRELKYQNFNKLIKKL